MTRPGFAFSTSFRVRYAEIDGQKVVFNSRYLEYADVALTDYWEWTGIAASLGAVWTGAEFHVRRAEVDYLKPFALGDTVAAFARTDRIGSSSLTQRVELAHAAIGDLHTIITITTVHVDLATGRPVPLTGPLRDALDGLVGR